MLHHCEVLYSFGALCKLAQLHMCLCALNDMCCVPNVALFACSVKLCVVSSLINGDLLCIMYAMQLHSFSWWIKYWLIYISIIRKHIIKIWASFELLIRVHLHSFHHSLVCRVSFVHTMRSSVATHLNRSTANRLSDSCVRVCVAMVIPLMLF